MAAEAAAEAFTAAAVVVADFMAVEAAVASMAAVEAVSTEAADRSVAAEVLRRVPGIMERGRAGRTAADVPQEITAGARADRTQREAARVARALHRMGDTDRVRTREVLAQARADRAVRGRRSMTASGIRLAARDRDQEREQDQDRAADLRVSEIQRAEARRVPRLPMARGIRLAAAGTASRAGRAARAAAAEIVSPADLPAAVRITSQADDSAEDRARGALALARVPAHAGLVPAQVQPMPAARRDLRGTAAQEPRWVRDLIADRLLAMRRIRIRTTTVDTEGATTTADTATATDTAMATATDMVMVAGAGAADGVGDLDSAGADGGTRGGTDRAGDLA
jgi:hypothetical protein